MNSNDSEVDEISEIHKNDYNNYQGFKEDMNKYLNEFKEIQISKRIQINSCMK
jgi:hypothetical protein